MELLLCWNLPGHPLELVKEVIEALLVALGCHLRSSHSGSCNQPLKLKLYQPNSLVGVIPSLLFYNYDIDLKIAKIRKKDSVVPKCNHLK